MITYRSFVALLLIGMTQLCTGSISRAENIVDNTIYAQLLEKYVHDGIVNYRGLKTEEQKLDLYLAILNRTKPEKLSKNEQFAFYINAYNAYTIKLILKHYPVKSIKDTGTFFKGPWRIKFCKIGGKTLTLDHIEHKILRPNFKDPRVHFAINCAARDCPPLLSAPYQGAAIDQQLDAGTRAFINHREKNYLKGNKLWVTRIFKWFSEDFDNDPLSFVLAYAEGEFKKNIETDKNRIKVKYLKYDWSLNGQ